MENSPRFLRENIDALPSDSCDYLESADTQNLNVLSERND